ANIRKFDVRGLRFDVKLLTFQPPASFEPQTSNVKQLSVYQLGQLQILIPKVNTPLKNRFKVCQIKRPSFTAENVQMITQVVVRWNPVLHQFTNRFPLFRFHVNRHQTFAGENKAETV